MVVQLVNMLIRLVVIQHKINIFIMVLKEVMVIKGGMVIHLQIEAVLVAVVQDYQV